MAGGHQDRESVHTGWRKHFDTFTLHGRKNATIASFALFALIYIGYKLVKASKADGDGKKQKK